ncbi:MULTISPECIES: hypothetical protein [Acidithiobacillus]|nr:MULTISPECIES: hypothetical protein [Acidithiobacillus]MDA8176488.1 hypothetical protein [Acidithiobacillus sp.]
MREFIHRDDSSVRLLIVDVQQVFILAEIQYLPRKIQELLLEYAHVAAN